MAVILAITILGTGLIGSYTTVPAAEFSAGALAASETLQWITAALGAVGISISVKELLKPRQADIEKDIGKHIDWDNYDWGDMLDSPAAQDQIDELDKTINRLYGNASAKWKEMYEKSLSPTPTPETSPDKPDPSPPVTVAPIDPDKVTPPGWDTLRKASMKNGYLALGAATYWCLKEALTNWWNKIMDDDSAQHDEVNKGLSKDLIGSYTINYNSSNGDKQYLTYYLYNSRRDINSAEVKTIKTSAGVYYYLHCSNRFDYYCISYVKSGKNERNSTFYRVNERSGLPNYVDSNATYIFSAFNLYIPYTLDGVKYNGSTRPMGKSGIWVNPDLKNDHDKNKSPSIPATAPAPAIKIPSLDDLKDLQNRGNSANDDERPSIILDWLKNHYTNPSTDPNPKPDPDPNPDPKPDPNPDPDPNPNPDPDLSPTPTTAPKPDDTTTDVNPDDYKADLRLVFPFCIPFDLIHLIQAFEAEPEAPVFEFPFDLELENPWTGKKILDYHHVFKLDMSDYEPVIKIFRIFEIIFFIIGLLMITRQQMIKG